MLVFSGDIIIKMTKRFELFGFLSISISEKYEHFYQKLTSAWEIAD